MCGISGLILRSGEKVDRSLLEKMGSEMSLRGPDFQGIYAEKNFGLVHRRLSIIDLSERANQPLFNETQDLSVILNGEIYNFRELRAELVKAGHVFRSDSDTEVLVHGFEEWGTESFRRLNGMFAFAILDCRHSTPILYLVRDRFGIKPLFYSALLDRIAFSSVLKPLRHVPWISREMDSRSLFHYLQFSHIPTPDSIFADVKQIEPGSYLIFKEGSAQIHRYWSPSEMLTISQASHGEKKEDAEWISQFENTLSQVVKRQIISDVPLGCFLSGGVDSSLLALAYSQLGQGKLKTFSIGYDEKEFDETESAETVAKALGTEHFSLKVGAKDFIEVIPKLPDYFDQPFADPTLLPSLFLSQYTRKHVTVALSGDGGDELFFGYPYQKLLQTLLKTVAFPKKLRKNTVGFLRLFIRSLMRSLPFASRSLVLHRAVKFCDILGFENEAELFQYFIGMVGPVPLKEIRMVMRKTPPSQKPVFSPLVSSLFGHASEDRISQVFVQTFLPDTVLAKADRASMAFSLEVRVPFLDNEMVEFSSRLPFHLKQKKGISKYLLRQSLAKKLPREISYRKKQGFSVPMRTWLRNDLRFLISEYLNEGRINREGIFVSNQVKKWTNEHIQGRANHSHLLWALLCFQIWREKYLN